MKGNYILLPCNYLPSVLNMFSIKQQHKPMRKKNVISCLIGQKTEVQKGVGPSGKARASSAGQSDPTVCVQSSTVGGIVATHLVQVHSPFTN